MNQVTLKYSASMNRLLSGEWMTACLGMVAKEVLQTTLGASSIAKNHLTKRQGSWPKLSKATLKDKRKRIKRTFVFSGTVAKAIVRKPSEGKLTTWGKGSKKRLSYRANGMYSAAGVNDTGFWMMTGFSGELKTSKEFNAKRKELAIQKGVRFDGLSAGGVKKKINQFVSVKDTHAALKGKSRKFAKAQGKNNLAYANVVQAGPFKGVKSNKTGRFYDPHEATRRKLTDYTEVRGKKPRELLPYDQADVNLLQQAMERGVQKTLNREFA